MSQTFLFLGGTARSGTTALTNILNCHRDCIIGLERYIKLWHAREVSPAHFEKDRFLSPTPEETDQDSAAYAERFGFAARFGQARYVGDKFPFISQLYGTIGKRFPEARILYILRDPLSVCESAQKRHDNPQDSFRIDAEQMLTKWNASAVKTVEAIEAGMPIGIVTYETMLASAAHVDRLYETLGLDPAGADRAQIDENVERFAQTEERPVPRRSAIRALVFGKARMNAYRALSKRCILGGAGAEAALATAERD